MINRNEFQNLAKKFRGGRISLAEFTELVYSTTEPNLNESGFDQNPVVLRLPVRPENSHKGDFGRILLVGGSQTMPGAIALSGLAALKSGAGLVGIATPYTAAKTVSSFSPCLMTQECRSENGLFSEIAADDILQQCKWADVVAVGPGMGRSSGCQKIVQRIYKDVDCPVVVDADGLNNLSDLKIDWADHANERIITPHPGEFGRIIDEKTDRRSEMETQAIEFARRSQLIVVLKGHTTMVTNGDRVYRNEGGNAGMATAGSGDVLTGVIASLIGQKMDAFESAAIGVYLHGLAGDLYSKKFNAASMIATDILEYVALAMTHLANPPTD